jgi:predicted transcriptional regulator
MISDRSKRGSVMADHGRVVTANLPADLVSRLDDIAARIDRSRSWIVRQALMEWLTEEQRRYELTLEALQDVDEGRTFTQKEVEIWFEHRRRERRKASTQSSEQG